MVKIDVGGRFASIILPRVILSHGTSPKVTKVPPPPNPFNSCMFSGNIYVHENCSLTYLKETIL